MGESLRNRKSPSLSPRQFLTPEAKQQKRRLRNQPYFFAFKTFPVWKIRDKRDKKKKKQNSIQEIANLQFFERADVVRKFVELIWPQIEDVEVAEVAEDPATG